jgi:LmbE family N-acetylglucosaminyl deacetylase
MNIVCFGAHPDDAEVFAGGTLVKCARAGHRVTLVSLTNGAIGHHTQHGAELARRRAAEAAESARRGGVGHRVLDFPDGGLFPTAELRAAIVRIIRECAADVVLTHRPCDYHPDHRNAAVAVQDAAYMVMVPHYVPDAPALRHNPVFLYMMDRFTKPQPFTPDLAVAVDEVMPVKWDMLDAMESQMYEWLPWIDHRDQEVPADAAARRAWLETAWGAYFRGWTDHFRAALARRYSQRAHDIVFAEFFELCEYGHCPTPDALDRLLPR